METQASTTVCVVEHSRNVPQEPWGAPPNTTKKVDKPESTRAENKTVNQGARQDSTRGPGPAPAQPCHE
eukprot:4133506-Amphidinium_carterae.1